MNPTKDMGFLASSLVALGGLGFVGGIISLLGGNFQLATMLIGPAIGSFVSGYGLDAIQKCAKHLQRIAELKEDEAKARKIAAAKKWGVTP